MAVDGRHGEERTIKYFIHAHWSGLNSSDWTFDEYQTHIEQLCKRIPRWFHEPTLGPHDSHLRRLHCDAARRILVIELDTVSRYAQVARTTRIADAMNAAVPLSGCLRA